VDLHTPFRRAALADGNPHVLGQSASTTPTLLYRHRNLVVSFGLYRRSRQALHSAAAAEQHSRGGAGSRVTGNITLPPIPPVRDLHVQDSGDVEPRIRPSAAMWILSRARASPRSCKHELPEPPGFDVSPTTEHPDAQQNHAGGFGREHAAGGERVERAAFSANPLSLNYSFVVIHADGTATQIATHDKRASGARIRPDRERPCAHPSTNQCTATARWQQFDASFNLLATPAVRRRPRATVRQTSAKAATAAR